MDTWIQFTLLMLTLLGFALRNERRITLLEGLINTEQSMRAALEKRVDKLEERNL